MKRVASRFKLSNFAIGNLKRCPSFSTLAWPPSTGKTNLDSCDPLKKLKFQSSLTFTRSDGRVCVCAGASFFLDATAHPKSLNQICLFALPLPHIVVNLSNPLTYHSSDACCQTQNILRLDYGWRANIFPRCAAFESCPCELIGVLPFPYIQCMSSPTPKWSRKSSHL